MKNYFTNLQQKFMRLHLKSFISIFLLFAGFLPVSAANINPNESIQLKIENGTIKEVLRQIENQCSFTFIYNDATINVNEKISLVCSGKPLAELLDEILLTRGIKYTFIDNHIVLTNESMQEKRTITGNVKDSQTGEPLPGVTIVEKGSSSNGTITDLNGDFTITVPAVGSVLVSYIGYTTKEIAVATLGENNSIALEPEIVSLSEIVVIGYGTVKKSDLTGAVSSISADDIKQNIGSGIDQALQGRTAGVTVTTNSGTPGAAPAVRIRGMGTITNPNPFYVVDGMPVSAEAVGSINPGDIESMEVLKDASSAAIYGARAANGVILITTKRAKEGKSNISFDAYTGIQNVAKKYEIMNGTEWTSLHNAMGGPRVDSSTVVNTDWQDAIFRQANVSNYQLSFLSGTEKINYAVIGSYFNQEGIVKGSSYERYTLRVNSSSNLKKWLTIGENIGFSRSNQNIIPEEDEYTSVIIQALTIDPTTPIYNEEGNPSGALENNIGNPVGAIERNHNVVNTEQLLGNAYLELKPFSWLSFKSTMGLELSRYNNEIFVPEFQESVTIFTDQTTLTKGAYNTNTLRFDQLLTLKKTFLEQHDVQLLVGYERQQSTFRFSLGQVSGIPDNSDLWFISNASGYTYEDIPGSIPILSFPFNFPSVPTDASMISKFARLIYSHGGDFAKVDLTASFRRDGSSKFGTENRWGNFPSFAAGWKISEEPFFPENDVLNFLKFRFGWGKLGNQEIGDYAQFTNVSYGIFYTLGPNNARNDEVPAGAPLGFANQGVKWEETDQTNIGLDANLFNQRLNVNFDYFIRNTNDMLAQVPVPGVSGVTNAPFVNVGSVSNKGFEINMNYRQRGGIFKYGIGVNVGAVKNEVISLGKGLPINTGSFRSGFLISRTEVGHPIASFYGYETDGLYQTQAEIDTLNAEARRFTGRSNTTYDGRVRPGDVKMVDQNGDHVITDADRTFIGSPHPKLTYGLNIDLEFKQFDLSIFGQGVYGNDVYMATLYYLESSGAYWNTLTTMSDYWRKEGDQTSVTRLNLEAADKNTRMSDRYVKDGSFFRIKNVQLGFTLPTSLVNRIGVEKLRVYVSGQNLLSFHNYKGFDPEIGTGRTTSTQRGVLDIGIDRGMYPLARTITAGVNLTF